jgi:O-6-methylguanine DNA methyltransferase
MKFLKTRKLTALGSFAIPVDGLQLTVRIVEGKILSSDVKIMSDSTSYSPKISRRRRTRDYCLKHIFGEPEVKWIALDTNQLTDFRASVYQSLLDVEAGRTISYGKLADRIGNTGGSRAVGQALQANPFPVIIPCHRVVRCDGTLGGYDGDEESPVKAWLLELESRR